MGCTVKQRFLALTFVVVVFTVACGGRDSMVKNAAQGQTFTIRLQLLAGAPVNTRYGLTPIQAAARNGRLDTVSLLLKHGAKINASSNNPLHLAILKDHNDMVQLLLDEGADPNRFSDVYTYDMWFEGTPSDVLLTDMSPLQIAALTGNLKAAEMLLDHKADINLQNANSSPPLYVALAAGNMEMIGLLRSRGANYDLDRDWESLFALCANAGEWDVFQLLIDARPGVTPARESLDFALCRAVMLTPKSAENKVQKLKITAWLIDHDADANTTDTRYGSTMRPLHLAALYDFPEAIELLVRRSALLNAQDSSGDTPLMEAVASNNLSAAAELLRLGANPDFANNNKETPLHHAAATPSISSAMVRLLLKYKANFRLQNQMNQTPLQCAAKHRKLDFVGHTAQKNDALRKLDILRSAELDPTARWCATEEALGIARSYGWRDGISHLEKLQPKKTESRIAQYASRLLLAVLIGLAWVRAAAVVRRPLAWPVTRRSRGKRSVPALGKISNAFRPLRIPFAALVAPELVLIAGSVLYMVFFLKSPPLVYNVDLATAHLGLFIGCFLYGLLRVTMYHPAFENTPGKSYRQWLETMPWDASRPLPFGPPKLVPWDIAAIAAVWLMHFIDRFLFASRGGGQVEFIVIAILLILLPYLVLTIGGFLITGNWVAFLLLAGGVSTAMLFYENPGLVLLVLVVVYVPTDICLNRALRNFPWPRIQDPWAGLNKPPVAYFSRITDSGEARKHEIGSPQNALAPIEAGLRIPPLLGFLIAGIGGWVIFVLSWKFGSFSENIHVDWHYLNKHDPALLVMYCLPIGLSIVRILVYALTNRPPISIAGRLLTGRWIIPGYDNIFIAPALAATIPFVLPKLMFYATVPPVLVCPIVFAISTAILLNMGPTLAHWRLTGSHRICAKNIM